MVNPHVWGPVAWQILFATLRDCDKIAKRRKWSTMLENFIKLLPCPKCRNHAATYLRTTPLPSVDDAGFDWLWKFKTAVLRRTTTESLKARRLPSGFASANAPTSRDDVLARFGFHDWRVDDVAAADVLVLFAHVATKEDHQRAFCNMAHALSVLLPLPVDSVLVAWLSRVTAQEKNMYLAAVTCAYAVRCEHGVSQLARAHYDAVVNDG